MKAWQLQIEFQKFFGTKNLAEARYKQGEDHEEWWLLRKAEAATIYSEGWRAADQTVGADPRIEENEDMLRERIRAALDTADVPALLLVAGVLQLGIDF